MPKKFKFRPRRKVDGPGTVSNGERAFWAAEALWTFREGKYPEGDDNEATLMDLICDLLHLADRDGLDPELILDAAVKMWRDER